ncbi:CAMK/CAMKL protein kinase [Plasmodium fragile]|uniref:CAMK/CAMKL protein kinase n=1 Tax=Plasmodium fragile TaxID=5857 RepID=A0A0D9QL99_PLAFR|nr:CAMK/CAMKL protein kinase [Plasmodium fragile]KJP87718.1 CAMK/CAMKL protein kinase [Plasmodium fragile]
MALMDKWRPEWDTELRLLPQVESIADQDLQITEDIFFLWQFLKMYHTSMPHVRNLIDFITIKKPEPLTWGEHIDDYMCRGIDRGQKLFNLLVSDGKRIQPRYSKKKLCDTLLYFRLKNYIILEKINTGSVGQVHLALDKSTDTLVAAKAIDKSTVQGDEELFQKLKEEISISCRMNHPCVVKTTNVLETRDKIIQIMEYCDGGDLISYVRNKVHLEELSAQYFFRKIVQGLQYMHRNNVSHRDLKPENIFLCKRQLSQREKTLIRIGKLPSCSEYELKIGDFGASCVNEKNKLHHDIVGTLSYAAPEVLGCKTTCGYSSQKADVWSLGIILYAMLFGLLPFDNEGKDLKEAYNSIIKNKIVFPKHRVNRISMNARNLLSGMLTINPANRLSLDEVEKHEWLADTGKTKLEVSHVHKKMNFPISSTVAYPVGSGKNDMDFETFKKLFLLKRENGSAITNLRVPAVVASAVPRDAQHMVPNGAQNGVVINIVPSSVQNVASGMVPHAIPCASPFGAPYAKPYASARPKENDQAGACPRSGHEKGQVCHVRGSNSLLQRCDPHHVKQNKNQNASTNHGQLYLYDDKGVLNNHVNHPNVAQQKIENPVYADALLAQKKKNQGDTLHRYALNQKNEEKGKTLTETNTKHTNDGNDKSKVCTQKGIINNQNNYYGEKTYFKNHILDNTCVNGKNKNETSSVNYYDGKPQQLEQLEKNKLKSVDQVNKNPHLCAKTNNTYDFYFNKNNIYRNQSNNIFLLPCKENLIGKNNVYSNLYFFKGSDDFKVTSSGRSTLLRHYDQGTLTTSREYDTSCRFKCSSNASDGRESTNTINSNCTNITPSHKKTPAPDKVNVSPSDTLFYQNPNYNHHVQYKYYYYDDKGTYVGCLSNQTTGRTCASSCVLLENQVNCAANNADYTKEWTCRRGVSEYVEAGTSSNSNNSSSNNNNACSSDLKREHPFVKHIEGEGRTKLASYEWGTVAKGALFAASENRANVMATEVRVVSKERNDLAGCHGHPRVVQQVGRAAQVGGQMGKHASNTTRDTLLTDGSITSKVSTPTNNDAELQVRLMDSKKKDTCIVLKKEGISPTGNKHSSLIKSQHVTKIVTVGEGTNDQMDDVNGHPKESHQKENKYTLNLFIQKGTINEHTKMDITQQKNTPQRDYTDEQSDKWNMQCGEKDDREEFLPSGSAPLQNYTVNTQNSEVDNNADEQVHNTIERIERKTEQDNQKETHKGDRNSPDKILSFLPRKEETKNVSSQQGSNTPREQHTEGECKGTLEHSYSDASETKRKKKKKKKFSSINNPSKEIQRGQSKSDPSGDDKEVNHVDKKKNITNPSIKNNRSGNDGQCGETHSCGESYNNSGTRTNHYGTDIAVHGVHKSSSKDEGGKNKVDKHRKRVNEKATEKSDMTNLSKCDSHEEEKKDGAEFRRYTSTEKTTYSHLEEEETLCKNEDRKKPRHNKIFNEEQVDGENKFLLLKKVYYSDDRDVHVLPNSENQHDRKEYINFEKIFPHNKRKTNTNHIAALGYYKGSNLCFSKRVKKDRNQRGKEKENVVKNQVDVYHRTHNPRSTNHIINIRHFNEWYYTNGCSRHELTTKEKGPSNERVPIYNTVAPYDAEQVSDKEYVYFSSNKIEYIKCATPSTNNQDSHHTYSSHYHNHTMNETNGELSNPLSDAHVVSADTSSTKCSEETDTGQPHQWREKPMQSGHNLNAIVDRHGGKGSTYNRGDITSGRCIPNLESHVFNHSPIDQLTNVHENQDNEPTRTERCPVREENSREEYSLEKVGSTNSSTSNDSNGCRRKSQGISTHLEEISSVFTSDATNNSYIGNDIIRRKDYTSLYDDVNKSYSIIQNVSYENEITKAKMKNEKRERIITRCDAKEKIQGNEECEQGEELRVKMACPTEHSTPNQSSDKCEPPKSTTMKISQNNKRPTNRKKGCSGEEEQDKGAKGEGEKATPFTLKNGPVWKNSPSNVQNCYEVEFHEELNRDLSEGSLERDKSQTLGSSANGKDTHLLEKDEGKNPHMDTQHIYMMNSNLKKQKPQGAKGQHEKKQTGIVLNGPIDKKDTPHEFTSSKTNEELTKNKKETTLKETNSDRSKHVPSWNILNVQKNDTIHSKEKRADYLTHNRSYDLKSARSNLLSMSYDENIRKDYKHGNLLVNPKDIVSLHDLKSSENDEKNKILYYYNLDTTPANLDILNNLMFYSSHVNPYRHYKNNYLIRKTSLTEEGVNVANSKQSSDNNRTEQRSDQQNESPAVDHNLRNYLNLNKTSIQNMAKMKRNYTREQNYENKFGTKVEDQREANSLYPKLRWMNIFSRNSSKH